jgi:hypothetical protein
VSNKNRLPLIPVEEATEGISRMGRNWRFRVAVAAAVVGGLSLVVSLVHLTPGLATRSGDPIWLALIFALTIDAAIVVTEAALVVASVEHIKGVRGWATAWLTVALLTSWWLNAVHLTKNLEMWSWSWYGNVFLGALIPCGVLVLSKIGSALAIGQRKQHIVLTEDEPLALQEVRVAEKLAQRARRKSRQVSERA